MRPTNLRGKVALITGASSGIGKACAISFAEEGCFVAITGRSAEALQEVTNLCHDAGLPKEKIFQVVGDVTISGECENIVNSTIKHFGKLNILVNNAGILVNGGIEHVSLDDYDAQMNTNVKSVFYLTKLCIPHLVATKGNIINVSSAAGIRSPAGVVVYNMSKAALDHLTRTVALEVAKRGVRVNSVNPGVVVTDIHRRSGIVAEDYKKFLKSVETSHPLGRPGDAKEVSDLVVFLASDNASFITGAIMPVDGGYNINTPISF